MKIKIGDKVYLQVFDILKMNERPVLVAECVSSEFLEKYGEMSDVKDGSDKYAFKYAFDNPDCVEWLMMQDYILDYDECVKNPESKIKDLQDRHKSKYAKFSADYNEKTEAEKRRHHTKYINTFFCSTWERESIDAFISLIKGEIPTFGYPEEYTGKRIEHLFTKTAKKSGFFKRLLNLFSA